MERLQETVVARIDAQQEALTDLSRKIQAHPELAYEELKAAAWLSGFLENHGFEVEREAGGLPTAFVASLRGATPGPTVAFLAEYDALPEVGHGCGHNLIGTGAAGAAAGVAAAIGDLPGTIQVVGTPAEEFTEGLAGKIRLLQEGAFSGVDVCLMFHPWTETAVAKRDFGFMVFDVSFVGRPAHAAADPHHGLNALDAVVLTYNAISALRQQLKTDARIHCIITHGGDAVNIIPQDASARVMFRSTDPKDLEALAGRIEACIQGAALSTGTEVKVQRLTHVQPSRFNASLYGVVEEKMTALGSGLRPMDLWGASSDFGNVSQEIPALSMLIKTHEPDINWHSTAVAEGATSAQAHAGMLLAAKALALSALELLTDPQLLTRVQTDFEESAG